MENIYYPIDDSKLRSYISKDEDILYSTLCKAIAAYGVGLIKWNTPLLLTKSGIVYQIPQKKESPNVIFRQWSDFQNVKSLKGGKRVVLRHDKTYRTAVRFVPIRDTTFESKSSYKKRLYKFGPYVVDVWIKYTGKKPKMW